MRALDIKVMFVLRDATQQENREFLISDGERGCNANWGATEKGYIQMKSKENFYCCSRL